MQSQTSKKSAEVFGKQARMLVTCIQVRFLLGLLFENLKMEATYSSEASAGFQRTALRYIQDNRTFHNHSCDNLIYHVIVINISCDFHEY
jgi:hypothetical protein